MSHISKITQLKIVSSVRLRWMFQLTKTSTLPHTFHVPPQIISENIRP